MRSVRSPAYLSSSNSPFFHQKKPSGFVFIELTTSRSLIFAFPDPEKVADKKPNPFDKENPFKNLGYRVVEEKDPKQKPAVTEVELTLREFTGSNGIQQFSKRFDI